MMKRTYVPAYRLLLSLSNKQFIIYSLLWSPCNWIFTTWVDLDLLKDTWGPPKILRILFWSIFCNLTYLTYLTLITRGPELFSSTFYNLTYLTSLTLITWCPDLFWSQICHLTFLTQITRGPKNFGVKFSNLTFLTYLTLHYLSYLSQFYHRSSHYSLRLSSFLRSSSFLMSS
jgi:hypothetical protein